MAEANKTDISPVAAAKNWQHRVEHERKAQQGWSHSWGFMAAQGNRRPEDDSLNQFISSVGNKHTFALNLRENQKRLEQAKQRQLQTQTSQAGAVAEGTTSGGDAVDSFMQGFGSSTKPVRAKAQRPYPKEEFVKPALESQKYGWGRNLERFGVMDMQIRLR